MTAAAGAPPGNNGVRIGRPPGATAAATRARILAVAEQQFAASGYNAATNQTIAQAAGVTSSSIYHHFGSKRDLYRAVSEQVHDTIFGRYEQRVRGLPDLASRLSAIVETSIELHSEDPTLARFLATSNADARHNPELHEILLAHVARVRSFSIGVAHDAVAVGAGGVDADDVANMISALLLGFAGLADMAESTQALTRAMRAFELLVRGDLR